MNFQKLLENRWKIKSLLKKKSHQQDFSLGPSPSGGLFVIYEPKLKCFTKFRDLCTTVFASRSTSNTQTLSRSLFPITECDSDIFSFLESSEQSSGKIVRQRERELIGEHSFVFIFRYETADLASNCPISNEGDRVERTTTIKHSKKRMKTSW